MRRSTCRRHAARACETALAMQARLIDLNAEWKAEAEAEGRPHIPVNIGIGLNTGQATVGNFGSTQRLHLFLPGRRGEPRLAARRASARPTRVGIIIGEKTCAAGAGLRRARARPRHGEGQDRAGAHLCAGRRRCRWRRAARVPDAGRPAGGLPGALSHRRLRRGAAGDRRRAPRRRRRWAGDKAITR